MGSTPAPPTSARAVVLYYAARDPDTGSVLLCARARGGKRHKVVYPTMGSAAAAAAELAAVPDGRLLFPYQCHRGQHAHLTRELHVG